MQGEKRFGKRRQRKADGDLTDGRTTSWGSAIGEIDSLLSKADHVGDISVDAALMVAGLLPFPPEVTEERELFLDSLQLANRWRNSRLVGQGKLQQLEKAVADMGSVLLAHYQSEREGLNVDTALRAENTLNKVFVGLHGDRLAQIYRWALRAPPLILMAYPERGRLEILHGALRASIKKSVPVLTYLSLSRMRKRVISHTDIIRLLVKAFYPVRPACRGKKPETLKEIDARWTESMETRLKRFHRSNRRGQARQK